MKKETLNDVPDGNANMILSCSDIKLEKFYVPDWACNVYIKQMTVKDITDLREATKAIEAREEVNLHTFLVCCCNKDGTRMFNLTQLPLLRDKSLHAVSLVVAKINNIIIKSNKDLEEQAKNF